MKESLLQPHILLNDCVISFYLRMKTLEDVHHPIDLVDIYLQEEEFWNWLKDYMYLIDWPGCDDDAIRSLVYDLQPDYYISFMLTSYRSYSRATFH